MILISHLMYILARWILVNIIFAETAVT